MSLVQQNYDAVMPKSISEKVDAVRNSNNIIRNHSTLVSNGFGYTVGFHIGGSVQLLFLIFQNPSVNLIRHVAFHDWPETITGDVVGHAKKRFPKLGEVLEEVEAEVEEEYEIIGDEPLTEVEHEILKMIDRLDLLLWCYDQYELGCKTQRFLNMFARVKGEVLARCTTISLLSKDLTESVDRVVEIINKKDDYLNEIG